jgi:GNAT superfamily N-acetyltransferase
MASRRFRPLKASDLAALPDPCARCAYWETSLSELAYPPDQRNGGRAKTEWADAVTGRWGYCGVLAVNDGDPIGFLTMAPAEFVPRLGAFASTPTSSDAAVLMSVQVLEEFRGHGIGRQLVQSAAALLTRRDIRALEAVGTNRPVGSCVLPTGWLEAVGFTIVRPHPVTPRLRMDLQATLRWKPDLGAAWSRLTDLVSQPAAPEPASYSDQA